MATKLIQESTLTNIANAIRVKTGKVDTMTPSEMVTEIGNISGGGTDTQLVAFIEDTITTPFYNEDIVNVGKQGFYGKSFPSLELPNATTSATQSFGGNSIKAYKLPKLATIGSNLFQGSSGLQIADFTAMNVTGGNMLFGCSNCKILIFRKSDGIVALSGTGNISNSGMTGTDARIYVPQSLVAQYQQGTNWATYYANNPNLFQPLEGSPFENPNYDPLAVLAQLAS